MAMNYKDQEGEMLTFIKRDVVIAPTDYSSTLKIQKKTKKKNLENKNIALTNMYRSCIIIHPKKAHALLITSQVSPTVLIPIQTAMGPRHECIYVIPTHK